MAESLAHRWGQIIGDVLEAATLPLLTEFAEEHGLYLDTKGPRPARRGKKVTWVDVNENRHDLDYVLERGGSPHVIGRPIAFIETAWRRYTKHSRNKAQEIQGAILPLVAAHQNSAPFMGAILAGVFTQGALDQLNSLGFTILFFSYDNVVAAFNEAGIDASFDEGTAEVSFREKIDGWEGLDDDEKNVVIQALRTGHEAQIQQFLTRLERSVTREIETVFVLPLHGAQFALGSIDLAIAFIQNYAETDTNHPVVHYLVEIRYNTGEQISGKYNDKDTALAFLRTFQPPPVAPAAD